MKYMGGRGKNGFEARSALSLGGEIKTSSSRCRLIKTKK